jgi:Zn-dependent oligopeptidase
VSVVFRRCCCRRRCERGYLCQSVMLCALLTIQAAVDRGHTQDGAYVITLSRSLVEPFITFSERRDLREKAWKLWTTRGECL